MGGFVFVLFVVVAALAAILVAAYVVDREADAKDSG